MHARIERDIENDELKTMFDYELQKGMEKSGENIKWRSNECKERFIEEIKKDIEQFEERLKDSLITLDRTNIDSGFDFSFNIDSGIDTMGLLASIGGLVLLLLMPIVGEFALFGGLVLGAIGIVKSVWSFFDSDYKKSQQKKEVDKNLHQICEKIAEDVKSRLESRKKDIWEKIEKLKANLRPVDNYERMKRQLKEVHERLGYISHNIHLIISKQGSRNE
ncbi:apolipoL family protein [Helicobacter pylori]